MEPQTDGVAGQLTRIIRARLEAGRLQVPSMPRAALAALAVLRGDNPQLRAVARCIEDDPLLSAQIVGLANCAAEGGGRPLGSVEQAVVRLGAQRIETVLIEASAQRLFQSRSREIILACRAVWEHSLAVAMLARELARQLGGADADTVYIAGLLHDVGKPVLAVYLLDAERQLTSDDSATFIPAGDWLSVLRAHHRDIGSALADKWFLPAEVKS